MSFEKIIEFTLKEEGGLTFDTGGLTNFGISSRSYPSINIRALTVDQAKTIYKNDFWDQIAKGVDDKLDMASFDMSVNMGLQYTLHLMDVCCWKHLLDRRRLHYYAKVQYAKDHNNPPLDQYLHTWLSRCDRLEKFLTDPQSS